MCDSSVVLYRLCKFLFSMKIQDGHHCKATMNLVPYWKSIIFLSNYKLDGIKTIHEWLLNGFLQSLCFFYLRIREIDLRLRTKFNIGPYQKNVLKAFFNEITQSFENKVGWNVPWMVHCKVFFKSSLSKNHWWKKCFIGLNDLLRNQ